MHERIHDADKFWNFTWRHKAGENEVISQAKFISHFFKSHAPSAIADEQKFDLWILADESGRDGEQIVVALELEEPGDFADDEIIRRDSQLLAQCHVIPRGEKRFQREGAENFCILFRPADSGGEILIFHRFGDDDEMSRRKSRVFFRRAKNEIAQAILKISKRWAVNCMDDNRNAGASGGEASKNSRLAAVRVDDVRFLSAQNFFQFSQREKIFQRMNGTDKFGNNGKQTRNFFDVRLKRTFRAKGRAGNQVHFDAGFLAQAQDGGDGVFLGAADDEPGDDVSDAHAARMIYFLSSRNRSATVFASSVLVLALAR